MTTSAAPGKLEPAVREAVTLWRRIRSGSLKRAQKGREDESTEGGVSAMSDMSSEILYLLDYARFEIAACRSLRADSETRPKEPLGSFGRP